MEGRGAKFRVYIPYGRDHLPAEQVDGNSPQVSTALRGAAFVEEAFTWLPEEQREAGYPTEEFTGQARSGPRVIVAEDNADMRELCTRLLARAYQVEAVSSGRAALEAARKDPPDLILSDNHDAGNGRPGAGAPGTRGPSAQVGSNHSAFRQGGGRRADRRRVARRRRLPHQAFAARELLARVATLIRLGQVRHEAAEALATGMRHQQALFRLADRLHRADSDAENLEASVEAILQAIQADRAAVLLREDHKTLRFATAGNFTASFRKSYGNACEFLERPAKSQPGVAERLDLSAPESLRHALESETLDSAGWCHSSPEQILRERC